MNGYDAAKRLSDGEAEEGELILEEPLSKIQGRQEEELGDYRDDYDARGYERVRDRNRHRDREDDIPLQDPFRYTRRFQGRSVSPASPPSLGRRRYDSPDRGRRRRTDRSRSRSRSFSRRGRYERGVDLFPDDKRRGEREDGEQELRRTATHPHDKEDEEEEDEAAEDRILAAMEAQEEDEEERWIEERRRKRQEILEKHRFQQQINHSEEHQALAEKVNAENGNGESSLPGVDDSGGNPATLPADVTEDVAANVSSQLAEEVKEDDDDGDGGGDVEYIDEMDMDKSGNLNIWRPKQDSEGTQGEAQKAAGVFAVSASPSGIGETDNAEHEARVQAARAAHLHHEELMDQHDDMFAETPEDTMAPFPDASGHLPIPKVRRGLVDNFDDAEGYYNFQVGEVIGQRYEVLKAHGKGVFSSVLRAKEIDLLEENSTGQVETSSREVAIKVIRSNDTMYKAGQMEKVILRKLAEADPEGRRHCIRLLGSFEYRQHLCLVFEPMDMDLRGLTKRYGRGVGLSLNAVRIYTQQMLVALHHLRNCGVIHADIKPDNILVNDRRTVIKLCDFGSAMFSGDNELTPYLVSRFYRAPEVILGLPYDHPMDMWSVGCVVYELFTGQILFPGKTNNEMLKFMMDVKGPFPKRMLKKGQFAFKHFESDPSMSFALMEEDAVTHRPIRRLIPNPMIKNDFSSLLAGQDSDRRKLAHLADLLERMMVLDPDKRINPKEALNHPFIKGNEPSIAREKAAARKVVTAAPRAVTAAALRHQK